VKIRLRPVIYDSWRSLFGTLPHGLTAGRGPEPRTAIGHRVTGGFYRLLSIDLIFIPFFLCAGLTAVCQEEG